MAVYEYGLPWIDERKLFEVTDHVFGKMASQKRAEKLPADPFTLIAQAKLLDEPLSTILAFDDLRARNKSLSNAVGLWHQKVLGLSPHLVELGANGGGVDLRTAPGYVLPRWDKPAFFEVKNRFNTIKASDEKELWDRLDLLARGNGAVSYVVQIIPRDAQRYDRPWAPSGRRPRETVRCCDGVTAYAMVFGREQALRELYAALPKILDDVILAHGAYVSARFSAEGADNLFEQVFPW